MPTKQEQARKRKHEYYVNSKTGSTLAKQRKLDNVESNAKTDKELQLHELNAKNVTKVDQERAQYFARRYKKISSGIKLARQQRYTEKCNIERYASRMRYQKNPELKKKSVRENYLKSPELIRAKKRKQYACTAKKKKARSRLDRLKRKNKQAILRAEAQKISASRLAFKNKQIKRARRALKNKPIKLTWRNILIRPGSMNIHESARILAKKFQGNKVERIISAKSVLKWVLYAYQEHEKSLKKKIEGLQNHCKKTLERVAEAGDQNPLQALCGESLHTPHTEPYFWDTNSVLYKYAPKEYDVYKGQTISINPQHQAANVYPAYEALRTDRGVVRHEWKCSSELCKIKTNLVVPQLTRFMTQITSCSLKIGVNFILKMTEHSGAKTAHSRSIHLLDCYSGKCRSKLPFLRALMPHFPEIRSLVNRIYSLIREIKSMRVIKRAIDSNNKTVLENVQAQITGRTNIFLGDKSKINDSPSETEIYAKYEKAFKALEKECLDTPVHPCVSCDKLFSKSQVSMLKNLRVPIDSKSKTWQQLQNKRPEETKNGCICRNCLDKIRKGHIPAACILNDLHIGAQPEVLSGLNDFEKMLIQRGKTFQVVVKTKPVGKNKRVSAQQQISKVMGTSIHLPLPLEETLKKLPKPTDPVNCNQELYVAVRGVPTKTKNIWQSIVSVDKVYAALKYFKQNNEQYKEIILPGQPQQLLQPIIQDSNVFELDNAADVEPEIVRPAMLTQVTPEEWECEEAHYTIYALHEPKEFKDATELYQMLKINEPAFDHKNKVIDVLCYPDLYPKGKFGQFHPRSVNLTSAEYIKTRLLSRHPQFRLNQQYLFYLLHDANFRQLKQGIFHKLNVTSCKGALNAGECLKNIKAGELEGNLTSVFSKLRNTAQYWVQPRNDVKCMAQHYGPATWFLTMSPSEWNWDDMGHYIKTVNKTVPGFEKKTTSQLVALDPVSASRFINIKFHAMLSFIMSDDAPLGKVVHYFYRREYQSRGLQHFHLLLWVEGAPILGESDNEKVTDFILEYVTCELPQKSNSPTLYERVTKYQSHRDNAYCMRIKKTKSGIIRKCRFGFPRPVTETLVLRDVVESTVGRRTLQSKCRLYDLPRKPMEININDYNPAILLAWDGNVDLQYVGEKTAVLNWYVTKYTTKSEKSHVGQTFEQINSTKSLVSRLYNFGLRILNNRECGALEASDTLMGIPLYGTDPDTTIRWLDVSMIRKKRLQKIDKIEAMNPNSKDIFYESMVDDHYPNRPIELEDESLYDFARHYDLHNSPLKSERESYKLPSGKYLIKRIRPYLINHYKYSYHQQPENYYYALIIMFLPWRTIDQLKDCYETYTEAFNARKEQGLLKQAIDYDERLKYLQTEEDRVQDNVQKKIDQIEGNEQQQTVDADTMNAAFQQPADMPEIYTINVEQNDQETFEEFLGRLNADQLRVLEHVKTVLTSSGDNEQVLRHFVSGVGGTGKSFLIKTISQWTKQCLQMQTCISAPTGLSAYNINGSTIYKTFQLPVEHGITPKFRPLSDEMLKILRDELKNVVLFIIDEVSMVSNLTLLYINYRMCEIFNSSDTSNGWFGKKHILLFGDLLQLPPVHEGSPFVDLSSETLTKCAGSLACPNIWVELVTYDELTINMRQAQDSHYADILNRIRIGQMNPSDADFLANKRISLGGQTIQENMSYLADYLGNLPTDAVCLCATGHQCAKINEEMLNRIQETQVDLTAIDSVHCAPHNKSKASKLLSSTDCSRTAGMEQKISVKVGCKIMLRRNIDVTLGLVNSAIGIILEIKRRENKVHSLIVQFQNGIVRPLERLSVKFELMDNVYVYREQFPISLSYAVTIHKCQGLSLENVLMDIGETVFTCGQTYVALSRVTSSEGLHIINFAPRQVKALDSAVLEYNRLRQKYRPDLPLMHGPTQVLVRYVPDRKWFLSKQAEVIQSAQENVIKSTKKAKRSTAKASLKIRGLSNNDNVSCYANAVIQMLYASSHVRDVIKRSNQIRYEFKSHLRDYEQKPNYDVLNTVIIRGITNNDMYKTREQQDCQEFLTDLLQTNESLKDLLSYSAIKTIKCTQCEYSSQSNEPDDTIIRVPLTQPQKTLDAQLRLVNNHWETLEKCHQCKAENKAMAKTEITRTSRHVLLHFLIFTFRNNADAVVGEKISPAKMTGVPTSRVHLGGKFYKPTAAIFHHGNTIENGHYTCFIKSGTAWNNADDQNVTIKKWPTGAKDMYLLMLTEV